MNSPTESTGDALPAARAAGWVATGILLSRLAGLVREALFARYLGTSGPADAFRAALRMPNVLQNLLGEGTLSASFIPVYSELLEQGREAEAGRVAGAVFGLLLGVAGVLALAGVLLAPVLVSIFLPGFDGQRRELTIVCVRILFPMTGILVLSAWSLGVLNSHRRFFVSYVAPVAWNAAMIGVLLVFGARLLQAELAVAIAVGALVGGVLQFAVQLPWVLRLERELRVRWDLRLKGVKQVVRNAGPVILGRGAVQVSGWIELILASFLAAGAVAALGYAQTLYFLPISLFGMAVAAAELPELARRRATASDLLRVRLGAGLRQIAIFVVPAVVGYAVLGEVVVAALYERGDFTTADTRLVYLVLFGYTVGLIASTATRLFNSAFFALQDTRTPARFAIVRVAVSGTAGLALMLMFQGVVVMGHPLGPVGLSLGAGVAAWVEWMLLRRKLTQRIGRITAGAGAIAKMFAAALAPAAALFVLWRVLPPMGGIVTGIMILVPYGLAYVGLARALGLREIDAVLAGLARRGGVGTGS